MRGWLLPPGQDVTSSPPERACAPAEPRSQLRNRFALQGYHAAAAALLALSGAWWALPIVPVLRHGKIPIAGLSFVLSVATKCLAMPGATMAVSYRAGWLLTAAVAGLLLGLPPASSPPPASTCAS